MKRTLLHVIFLSCTWIIMARQVWPVDLPPPQDVHLDSVLRWRSAAESSSRVKYTAQYLTFDPDSSWQDVPGCVQTDLTTCNISSIPERPKRLGCVMLSIYAVEGSHRSKHVQAYSLSLDNVCSPVFTLTPLPGGLTVHINNNNSLSYDYADNAQYSINYTVNGYGPLQIPISSSKHIKVLEIGARVCVTVQYMLYGKPYGSPSKEQCEHLPISENDRLIKVIIIFVPVLMAVAVLAVAGAYIIIKKPEKIKQLLRPPISLPDHIEEFLSQPFSLPPQTQTTSPSEERYDHIFLILPASPDHQPL